jgi:anthranilate synthase/aminodeoxychorismate synthase-like glutamine amidotransferase
MILVIDNYDSFTFNLVQLLYTLGAEVKVARNDEIDAAGVVASGASHVVVSPGPCTPYEAGVSMAAIREARVPVFGVCLGHQSIGAVFGGKVIRAPAPVHGKTSAVRHTGVGLFTGASQGFQAGRYHSLVVEASSLPAELEATAWTADGLIMGLKHRQRPVVGVQFHPESVLTPEGPILMKNFLGAILTAVSLHPSLPLWICGLLVLGAGCASAHGPATSTEPSAQGQGEYRLAEDVSVRRLAPGVWLHTTLGGEAYANYPANGLVVEEGESALLVDTGWNPQQAERLMRWAQEELRRPVRAAVVTHSHNDRAGGISALLARGLPVYGLEETSRLAAAHGEPVPSHTFSETLSLGPLELFFPGAGHARDNIVVWYPRGRVLFGGCFIKAAAAQDLGNVADADTTAWPASLGRAQARFPEVRIVVPGHGEVGGPELLKHTQQLL